MTVDFRKQTTDFVTAFNQANLEQVVALFADDATYTTYDGQFHQGKTAIKQALNAQFRGDFGRLEFILNSMIIDEAQQAVAITWRCEHHMDLVPRGLLNKLKHKGFFAFASKITGKTPYWQGVDILKFRQGLVISKETFAQAMVPLFKVF